MQTVVIRRATAEDAELIADLSRRTFYDANASQNTKEDMEMFMDGPFTRKGLIEEVKDKENIFLLAFVEDEAAGYVRMREGDTRPELMNQRAMEIARTSYLN